MPIRPLAGCCFPPLPWRFAILPMAAVALAASGLAASGLAASGQDGLAGGRGLGADARAGAGAGAHGGGQADDLPGAGHAGPDATAGHAGPDATAGRSTSPALFSFALPIACDPGKTCFIQSYVDHDPGAGFRDFTCGGQTYDGHQGTDFRLPSLALAGSTKVLAAAPGVVRAVRDHVPDQRLGAIDLAATSGIECGNGLVIDHGDGWESQYCHMRAGSLTVAAGQTVRSGQVLGAVGLSGNTEFTHLHFSLRHHGRTIDPFSPTGPPAPGNLPASCEPQAASLWDEPTRKRLVPVRSVVLNKGFAPGAVSMDEIERGAIAAPDHTSPALVAYARAINLHEGDVLMLEVFGPDGALLADTATQRLDRHKAQWMLYTGQRRRGASWPRGPYRARVAITNSGRLVHEERFAFTL